jgi:hypothetical protein
VAAVSADLEAEIPAVAARQGIGNGLMATEDKLTELVDRLRAAHAGKLVSVILYGSAAGTDYHGDFSDLNVLCVLTEITPADLRQAEPVFAWWRKAGNPAPLLMSEDEVRTSTDCFPIEFHDMQEQRRVLAGKDPIAELAIDRSFYRAQVEHELRAKLFRLRQKAAGVLSDDKALLQLMADSTSTFCVLARHALLLAGVPVSWQKREVVAKLREVQLEGSALEQLLDFREKRKQAGDLSAGALFSDYLKQIEALVAFVDRLAK